MNGRRRQASKPLIDPRDGDIEADASSTKSRSLLALAGVLLAEVSLPKLVLAVILLVVTPALLLGLTPLLASIWFRTFSSQSGATGLWAVALLIGLVALAWFGGRRLFRAAEASFWSLNAMAVQPIYAAVREGFAHLAGRVAPRASEATRERIRALSAAVAGAAICAAAAWLLILIWPSTHWIGTVNDLQTPHWLALAAIANSIALAAAYLAIAALVWGIADAMMPQTRELRILLAADTSTRTYRVAHISDLHVVGERFGFRLGSGRDGPRGNDALLELLDRLDDVHATTPLDAIVVSGDLTDAGTSAEWAEWLDALASFPRLRDLIVALPGNHDVNVVDRANPARLDLPTSPTKRLRQMRTLSALAAIQGSRARVIDHHTRCVGSTLDELLAPHAADIARFADKGTRRLSAPLDDLWVRSFPMVFPPTHSDRLGIIALNSNAETHFSVTNALGMISIEQAHALDTALAEYPDACWIVALHHHIVEHPRLGNALAERIGTTLVNGNSLTRRLLRTPSRIVVMHGHRHIDWTGQCGGLAIVSAPSAVMDATARGEPYFYVHSLELDGRGTVRLRTPERINVRRPIGHALNDSA
jgi:3',5'-cyclic AMP phosphodiesterase CpdA